MAMQLMIAESFERFGTASSFSSKWIASDGVETNSAFNTVEFVTGSQSFKMTGSASPGKWRRSSILNANAISVNFSIYIHQTTDNSSTTNSIVRMQRENSSIDSMHFRLGNNNDIVLKAHTVNLSGSYALTTGVWHQIQFNGGHDDAGWIELYVDGILRLSQYNSNTRPVSVPHFRDVILSPYDSATGQNISIDNLVVFGDTAYQTAFSPYPSMVVRALTPNSNGTNRDFTPSSGTDDFAVVDEGSPDGADYLESNTNGHRVTIGHTSVSSNTSDTIYGVVHGTHAQVDDAGSRDYALTTKSSATTDEGAVEVAQSGLGYAERVLEVDPNTSAAWTTTGLDAAEFGVTVKN